MFRAPGGAPRDDAAPLPNVGRPPPASAKARALADIPEGSSFRSGDHRRPGSQPLRSISKVGGRESRGSGRRRRAANGRRVLRCWTRVEKKDPRGPRSPSLVQIAGRDDSLRADEEPYGRSVGVVSRSVGASLCGWKGKSLAGVNASVSEPVWGAFMEACGVRFPSLSCLGLLSNISEVGEVGDRRGDRLFSLNSNGLGFTIVLGFVSLSVTWQPCTLARSDLGWTRVRALEEVEHPYAGRAVTGLLGHRAARDTVAPDVDHNSALFFGGEPPLELGYCAPSAEGSVGELLGGLGGATVIGGDGALANRSSPRLALREPGNVLDTAVARKARLEDCSGPRTVARHRPSRKKIVDLSRKCGVSLGGGEADSLREFAPPL